MQLYLLANIGKSFEKTKIYIDFFNINPDSPQND